MDATGSLNANRRVGDKRSTRTALPDTGPTNAGRLAAAERKSQPPALLNEGQAASLLGIGRRKFHDIRQQA